MDQFEEFIFTDFYVFCPKTTSRRISIATIPRSVGGQTHFDMVNSPLSS